MYGDAFLVELKSEKGKGVKIQISIKKKAAVFLA
jgi:copper(I)-binding protein